MIPGTFNFRPQYKGNTFKGAQFTLTRTVGGTDEPLDLTGAALLIQFKKSATSPVDKEFTLVNGLTMVDALRGIVKMDSFLVTLDPFKYLYDFRVTYQDGTISTYLTGTFEVKQNLV